MNSSDQADVGKRKPRSKGCLLIALALAATFVYFVAQIWLYDPDHVVSVRAEDGYDAVRFERRGDPKVVLLIGAPMPPEPTRNVARDLVGQLIEGRHIDIETDKLEKSKEDNLLAYVRVKVRGGQEALDSRLTRLGLPPGKVQLDSQGRVFINELLIRLGLARSQPELPNLKYHLRFAAAETEAKQEALGLWRRDGPKPPTP